MNVEPGEDIEIKPDDVAALRDMALPGAAREGMEPGVLLDDPVQADGNAQAPKSPNAPNTLRDGKLDTVEGASERESLYGNEQKQPVRQQVPRSSLSQLSSNLHEKKVVQNYEACAVCHGLGDVICCDYCPRVFHLDCLVEDPPNEGLWECGICSGRTTLRELVTLYWQKKNVERRDWCFACLKRGKLICCDRCPAVFHLKCASREVNDKASAHTVWHCPVCTGKQTHSELRNRRLKERKRHAWYQQILKRFKKRNLECAERRRRKLRKTRTCAFCHKEDLSGFDPGVWHPELGGEALVGYSLGQLRGLWELKELHERFFAHRQCAIWAPMVFRKGPEWRNVPQELHRARGILCAECRRGGAANGCVSPACRKSYHLACAGAAHCYLDYRKHILYCNHHFLTERLSFDLPDSAGSTGLQSNSISTDIAELRTMEDELSQSTTTVKTDVSTGFCTKKIRDHIGPGTVAEATGLKETLPAQVAEVDEGCDCPIRSQGADPNEEINVPPELIEVDATCDVVQNIPADNGSLEVSISADQKERIQNKRIAIKRKYLAQRPYENAAKEYNVYIASWNKSKSVRQEKRKRLLEELRYTRPFEVCSQCSFFSLLLPRLSQRHSQIRSFFNPWKVMHGTVIYGAMIGFLPELALHSRRLQD